MTRAMLGHLMAQAGLSTRSLAKQAKGNKDSIHRLISGQQDMCRDDLADRIEQVLQVPAGSLFSMDKVSRRRSAVTRRSVA